MNQCACRKDRGIHDRKRECGMRSILLMAAVAGLVSLANGGALAQGAANLATGRASHDVGTRCHDDTAFCSADG
jgi:hypothetical protein